MIQYIKLLLKLLHLLFQGLCNKEIIRIIQGHVEVFIDFTLLLSFALFTFRLATCNFNDCKRSRWINCCLVNVRSAVGDSWTLSVLISCEYRWVKTNMMCMCFAAHWPTAIGNFKDKNKYLERYCLTDKIIYSFRLDFIILLHVL